MRQSLGRRYRIFGGQGKRAKLGGEMGVRMKARIALIAGVAMTLVGAANAADIRVNPPTVDRGASVWVTGELHLDDSQRFAAEVDRFRLPAQTTVVLEGPGGSIIAGLQIGELIHKRGWATMVYTRRICASACATAWLAGSPRYLYPQSHVGFHAAYNTLTGQQTGWTNALVGAYMSRLGLDYTAVRYVTIAAPESVTWLTATAAADYGIAVQELAEPTVDGVATFTDTAVEAYAKQLTPKSAAWVRAHPDYVVDKRKNAAMLSAHYAALAKGIEAESASYFEYLETSLGLRASPPNECSYATPPYSGPCRRHDSSALQTGSPVTGLSYDKVKAIADRAWGHP